MAWQKGEIPGKEVEWYVQKNPNMARVTVILFIVLIVSGCSTLTSTSTSTSMLVESDLVLPVSKTYDYRLKYIDASKPNVISVISGIQTSSGGRPAIPSGIQFGFNLDITPVSPIWTIGPVLGFQRFYFPDLSIIKLGFVSRLYFMDKDSFFIFFQGVFDIPVDREQFSSGYNIRTGIGYPVWKKDWANFNLTIFYDRHVIDNRSGFPVFDLDYEIHTLNSIGLGFGIQFLENRKKRKTPTFHKYLPENRKL